MQKLSRKDFLESFIVHLWPKETVVYSDQGRNRRQPTRTWKLTGSGRGDLCQSGSGCPDPLYHTRGHLQLLRGTQLCQRCQS